MSDLRERALKFHKDHEGKIALKCKVPVRNSDDLTMAYTPGVAEPCLEINKNFDTMYDYTAKGNLVAVVTNGTAVLGLGNIGAGAGMPVMEGKAVLFKAFGGVDAFPICLDTMDSEKIIETVKLMEPTFGGVNLEDIKAPECFEIEAKLKEICNIPIFHDDQHGTAIVTVAGIINALKIVNKKFEDLKVVVNGAGAAGTAITKLIMSMGTKNIILCDTKGAIYEGRPVGMNKFKNEMAAITNPNKEAGTLAEVLKGADVFIGVSAANCVSQDMVRSMNKDAIIMAMANPVPEILPHLAIEAGAKVVGTGRSDFPNQVNNVLAFPGIFRGALDVRASDINDEMKIAAAYAIADLVDEKELSPEFVIPSAFDLRIAPKVAARVAKAAIETGVARRSDVTPEMVEQHTKDLLK
ncbi:MULTISPECIES: NAD(P)-dependent malic enzyme [Clostridium]|uniref:NAD(P)-dependent malic enzyme n=1 Tax=Clostridium TaxID=1485 RepID=UPI0004022B86|nr:malic enzyme-like NAD(P)-binding protein [Clostridium cadaveris]MDU4952289.1 malic enzyme-like NAD(P)-binding protein [Clostridium sp.]MDY4948166.1 malic enzyme-like NAD(P)-binding protein [Clostridium cadaveris]NME65248.1 NAD-dependent malic enzyme [Clostridium cadaveris]NWK10603.1 NAD-dependent malic enzyme [Clostridium cadaveris]UFH66074.1 NAD-dependent malic enzyme [Clostridium cadaveris]